MKYIFKPIHNMWSIPTHAWYETTNSTPYAMGEAGFAIRDLRRWFLQWVFK